MEKTLTTKTTAKKTAVRFFRRTLAVLLISSIFIWGFQTSWGGCGD